MANPITVIVDWAKTGVTSGTLRGVNSSGGEFGAIPGVYNTDYHYDSLASLQYLYGRGHRTVRLPFLWERIQPTLGTTLNAAELGRLNSFVTSAVTAGLGVILDVHNYGAYNGVKIGAGGGPTQAQFADLWTRLSTAFKTNAGVVAYGLMNEPNGLPSPPLDQTNRVSTNFSNWFADDGAPTILATTFSSRSALKVTRSTQAFNGASATTNVTVTAGETLTMAADVWPATASGRSRVRLEWRDAGNSILSSTSSPNNTIPTGAWYHHEMNVTVPASATQAKFSVFMDDQNTAGDNFYISVPYVASPSPSLWVRASQAAVTAIRANADTKTILVPGDNWSGVADWTLNNGSAGWITDSAGNFLYEGHHYWDRDHSGAYANTYSAEVTDSTAIGWTAGAYPDALTNRVISEFLNWRAWLVSAGVGGFVGEMGWPRNNGTHTGDYTSWNALGERWYDTADATGIGVTYWSTSEWWGTYSLSLYDTPGSALSVPNSQAATVEAHLQGTGASDVTDRIRGPIAVTYGRDQGTALSPVAGGRGGFNLDNSSRDYSRLNASSPLFGLVKPARPVTVTRTVGGATFGIFRGHTDNTPINPDVDSKQITLNLVDSLADFSGVNITTPLYQGIWSGQAVGYVLDAVGWTGPRDLDTGASWFPVWWEDGTDAVDALNKILSSEGPPSLLTIDSAGGIVFRDRQHRLIRTASKVSQATIAGLPTSPEPAMSTGYVYDDAWGNIVNTVLISVGERAATANLVQVWQADELITLAASASTTVVLQASDPFKGAVPPVAGIDYVLVSGGIASATLTRTSGQSTSITLTATGAGATLQGMALRAYSLPVGRTYQVTASDATSIVDYGQRGLPSGRDPVWASRYDAQAIADLLVLQRKQPLPTLQVRFVASDLQTARLAAVLALDLSDRVTVSEPESAVTGGYFVETITHTVAGIHQHEIVLGLEAVPAAPTSVFIVGTSTLNGGDPLGY